VSTGNPRLMLAAGVSGSVRSFSAATWRQIVGVNTRTHEERRGCVER